MPRYAAIDIGSNSIRMEAAEASPGLPMRVLASERVVTRLGESVFRNGLIAQDALDLSCAALARMAQQYQKLDIIGVRAVATSAVRDARNQDEFIRRASSAIGTGVEIISGREESRLVHLGVQARWPQQQRKVLIVDIGGGSAELIASEHGQMRDSLSKPLGAVRLQEIFLQHDPPLPREIHQMEEFIEEKLAGIVRRFSNSTWDRIIGTSATASAVVCAVNRIPRTKREQADRLRAPVREVRRLYAKLSQRDLAARRKMTGIGPKRAEIIIPGTCVFLRVLEDLRLPGLYYSVAGVRDGIIADLAARGTRELSQLSRDQRKEVERMSRRYGVPLEHARQVASLAHVLFTALHALHQLPAPSGKLLEAAAYLHDTGHYVADSNHHKHSYYLVSNADMPGFTSRERELIANLCRYHRKTMPVAAHSNWQALNSDDKQTVLRLIPLLRLADGLDVSNEQRVESLNCRILDGEVLLEVGSAADVSLEQWAAERAAESFEQTYGKSIATQKVAVSLRTAVPIMIRA